MKVLFYTNCQDAGFKPLLSLVYKDISYFTIPNYETIRDKETLDVSLLKSADVFIYQHINKRHGIYSTDISIENNILTNLSDHCIKISFQWLYNSVLWILIPPAFVDNYLGEWKDADKYVNAESIQKLKRKGYSLSEIIDLYRSGKIDFEFERRVEEYTKVLQKNDEICDIKVADFILNNIHKRKIFFTQNHPATCIYVHLVNQVLKILGNPSVLDANNYGENICNFSGDWPHTLYDKEYWNFEYNEGYNGIYIPHISNIYNLFE